MEKLIEASKQNPNLPPKRTFINNIFEGIETVMFRDLDYTINGMKSKENELVKLHKPVSTEREAPDSWLRSLET